MGVFATVDDYAARYGEPEDAGRVSALLADASAFISSLPGFRCDNRTEDWWGNLTRVTCGAVHRSLMAGGWAGLSNVSQGAGGYTASATVYNPGGDIYLTKAEKASLGLGGGRVGMTDPFGEPGGEDPC